MARDTGEPDEAIRSFSLAALSDGSALVAAVLARSGIDQIERKFNVHGGHLDAAPPPL